MYWLAEVASLELGVGTCQPCCLGFWVTSSHNSFRMRAQIDQQVGVPPEVRSANTERPFWVILEPLEHFLSGHDTLEEAEAEAQRLNAQALRQGRAPHYGTKPRPQSDG